MQTRPSALTVVAALNRLGAVAVLMRPDGDPEPRGRARQGATGSSPTPQNAEARRGRDAACRSTCSAAAAGTRKLARGPDRHGADRPRRGPACPPGTGPTPAAPATSRSSSSPAAGERTLRQPDHQPAAGRCRRSAPPPRRRSPSSDTVYSATPVYHPSALLMSVGGAIAGGARLAVASEFDARELLGRGAPLRRDVVSYTWTMLDEIAEAPPNPAEKHHPVRLFMGSGMPRGLWKPRAASASRPARVLEFYASTEGDAVLVNLTGEKAGCKGRPLPGSAEVRIAALRPDRRPADRGRRRLRESPAPSTRPGCCSPRVRPRRDRLTATASCAASSRPGDAWLRDRRPLPPRRRRRLLARRPRAGAVRTADGVVPAGPIQDALGRRRRGPRSRSPTACRRRRCRRSPARRSPCARDAKLDHGRPRPRAGRPRRRRHPAGRPASSTRSR